jgi:acetylornithine deacetylase
MQTAEQLSERAIEVLADLVGFDTTSRDSNLDLIAYVEALLEKNGITSRRVPNADGTKTNLMAIIGPHVEGGVALSGHTDVVPVDGQAWTSDPFVLTRKGPRLYGRGTSDMKSFLALTLAAVPDMVEADLKKPLYVAFSYDEEVGCLGAPDMIAEFAKLEPPPAVVVVGEPTNMQAISGHKGIASFRVTVTGREAHSSLTHMGVSANMAAIRLMNSLITLSDRLEREFDPASLFLPKGATLTIGQVNGGTAVNILARECVFIFDLRTPPGMDPFAILTDFMAEAEAMDAALKARAPEAGVKVEARSLTPAFAPELDGKAEALARAIAGDNGPMRVAPYAAEAGQFQGAGFSTVICGPGSIDQAHQPDEFIEISQIERGAEFMVRLVEEMSR